MTAATVVLEPGHDWLSEMTDLYGKPAVSEVGPTCPGGPHYSHWYWQPGIGVVLRMECRRYSAKVYRRGAEVLFGGDEPPATGQVRTLLELVGVLPCLACRGLREVPTGRDEEGERWTACECAGASPRPLHGYAEAVSADA